MSTFPEETATGVPVAPTDPRRRLALTGTYNLRDVGGYPTQDGGRTRWGVLYRSDGLSELTLVDHEILADRGLRVVLDLRDDDEFLPSPDAVQGLDVRHVSVPIFENSLFKIPLDEFPTLEDHYRKILREHKHQVAAAVRALGENDSLPAIVHCTAGKDRTGLIVALVLSLVGVSDRWIVRDYEASQEILGAAFVRKVEELYDQAGIHRSKMGTAPTASPARFMVDTLEGLRQAHGSLDTFLRDYEVPRDVIANIREQFVVPGVRR